MTGPERRRLGRRAPRVAGDDGASSIELVMYTPILMLVTFLIVQFALTWHGQEVAGAVAREAAREARIGGGTPEALTAGETKGMEYVAVVGGKALEDVTVDVVLVGDDRVRATVTGRSVEVVPGFAPRVRAAVEGPIETFRPDL